MGFLDGLKRKPTVGELDEKLERVQIENEIVSKEAEKAEKEAVIRQLKREYGPNWMKTLGLNKFTDLSTLKSMLKSANQGMHGLANKAGVKGGENLSPLQDLTKSGFGGIHKA